MALNAPPTSAPFRPLRGVKVIDITSVVMGPLATQVLADQGANVISIEPHSGDPNRAMGRGPHPELSGISLNLMRNKRSVGLDFRHPGGQEALRRLLTSADVFVTNLRPGSRRRAGIGPEDVLRMNPSIVYCSASGFAPTDVRADEPAYDDVVQAMTGVVDLTIRTGGPPRILPTVVADKVCAMAIVQAVTGALLERTTTKKGVVLELSMYDIMRGFTLVEHGAEAIPEPPVGGPGYQRVVSVGRRPLKTTDGVVVILAYERHQFEALARLGNREDLIADPRFKSRLGRLDHIDELYDVYAEIAAAYSTRDFVQRCQEGDIPVSDVATLESLVSALPLASHPTAGPYRIVPSLAPGVAPNERPRRLAPLIGQHGREVLAEIGYEDHELDGLESSGALLSRRTESDSASS